MNPSFPSNIDPTSMAHPPSRCVIVFVGKYPTASTIEHLEAVADAFPHWNITILQEITPFRWRQALRARIRRFSRAPIAVVMDDLRQLAVKLASVRAHRRTGSVHFPRSPRELKRGNVQYRLCRGLHDAEVLEFVRSLRPWLGIAISAPILKPCLFEIPEQGTINLHKGLLPHYRGMPPGFWELHDGASEVGVTVHWIDKGLDTGDIIAEQRMPVPPFTTPRGLAAELDLLGTRTLVAALGQIDRGIAPRCPQETRKGRAGTKPSWMQARAVRHRLWNKRRERVDRQSWYRALLKFVALVGYVFLWSPLRNVLRRMKGQCHTTVLIYHRVSDQFLDSVTVGIEQFQQQLKVLQRHYDVLDLATFLAERGKPRRRPAVVITFDDGYEDNYLAASLMRRCGLPCTFFLSTRIVGSDNAFPHDWKRLGRRVPALSWEQVRTMQQWGFDFGNHTAHHANLGALNSGEAVEEIATATEDLRREIGAAAAIHCLAYPYGKPEDITAEVRGRLAELGICYCFSAFGGVNFPNFDEQNIVRQGADYKFGLLAFRAIVEGWTLDWRNQDKMPH